jgi:radical SAM protein with 4Fe4S-binding SPASM domain
MSFTLGIEVTRRCNFRCPHCFVDAGRARDHEATTAEMEALLGEAARSGVGTIGWSGGEPLLRKDLERLTARATTLGMSVGLVTNGYFATRERLSALQRAGLRVVQVSLDGADAARAGRFRQGPRHAFERAVAALETSVSLGLKTWLCALLAPETAGEVDEMHALARRLGVTGLRYATYVPVGRAEGRPVDESGWARPEVGALLRTARQHGRAPCRVLLDCPAGPLPGMRRFWCDAGRSVAYLTADGDLYPCTALMYPELVVGNAFQRPLGVILAEGRMLATTRALASRPARGECATCRLAATCRSGCPGRTRAELGRIVGRGHRLSMPGCLLRLHS